MQWKCALLTGLAVVVSACDMASSPPQAQGKPPEFVWRVDGNTLFRQPGGLALDSEGNLLLWDGAHLTIRVFDPNGKPMTSWGRQGTEDGQFTTSGQHPYGSVAVDQQGNVYVPDYGNARVQKFDRHGTFIAQWGKRGSGDGEFTAPYGIAVSRQERVYVIDDGTAMLQVFDRDGKFLTKFGGRGTGNGQFQNPSYITVDGQGSVYIPDFDTARIQKFDPQGVLLATWIATCGDAGKVSPSGITVDSQGNAYVTDFAKARICKFDSQGRFLYAWGSRGTGNGLLTDPQGIVADDQGNIYVDGGIPPFVQKFRQN